MASSQLSGLRMQDYTHLLACAQKSLSKTDVLAVLKHMRRSKVRGAFSAGKLAYKRAFADNRSSKLCRFVYKGHQRHERLCFH